jgi:copper homeostasis protein CutC
MGGSGVRVQNAAALCEATGLSALHASLRRPLQQEDTTMVHVLPDALPTYELREEDVRALAAVLESCARTPSSRSQLE